MRVRKKGSATAWVTKKTVSEKVKHEVRSKGWGWQKCSRMEQQAQCPEAIWNQRHSRIKIFNGRLKIAVISILYGFYLVNPRQTTLKKWLEVLKGFRKMPRDMTIAQLNSIVVQEHRPWRKSWPWFKLVPLLPGSIIAVV